MERDPSEEGESLPGAPSAQTAPRLPALRSRQGPWPAGWQPPWYSRALLMICLMMRSVPTRVLSLLLSSFGRRKASTRSGNEQAVGAKPTVTEARRPGDGTQPRDSGCRHRIPHAGASRPVHPHVRSGAACLLRAAGLCLLHQTAWSLKSTAPPLPAVWGRQLPGEAACCHATPRAGPTGPARSSHPGPSFSRALSANFLRSLGS